MLTILMIFHFHQAADAFDDLELGGRYLALSVGRLVAVVSFRACLAAAEVI